MKAITLRNIPTELARALERRSRQNRRSLNQTVLEVLAGSLLGQNNKKEARLNHELDWMAGRWTPKEADAFDQALAAQRTIDPDVWK